MTKKKKNLTFTLIKLIQNFGHATEILAVNVQQMDKVMETFVEDKHLFVKTKFDHHMPVI
jgi:hypothetical protein